MKTSQAIRVLCLFDNRNVAGSGRHLDRFINSYTARPTATQSIPGPGMVNEWNQKLDYLYEEKQFNSTQSFADLANHYLKTAGVSFDNQYLSLSNEELRKDGKAVQQAFDDGKTALRMIISFDTNYLIKQNVINLPSTDRQGNPQAQSLPGQGFNLVDENKLRQAVQIGMNTFVNNNGMSEPLWVGALQFDRDHVHAHITCIDQGDLTKSGRLINYQGFWQDKGQLGASDKKLIRNAVDASLTLNKGVHRSTLTNQAERSLVNTMDKSLKLQRQYQKQVANQLLQLRRLLTLQQRNDDENDLYQDKLADYRDSLVMQEAQQFGLPQNITSSINQQLDTMLDRQLKQVAASGIPDTDYLRTTSGFNNSVLRKRLVNQDVKLTDRLELDHRMTNYWRAMMTDYNHRLQNDQVGSGSMAMYSLYGYEFNRSLKQLDLDQCQNPLKLLGNERFLKTYQVQQRGLERRREKLLEIGYQAGFLNSPDYQKLNGIIHRPKFQQALVKQANHDWQNEHEWVNDDHHFKQVEEVPTYWDLEFVCQHANDQLSVNPQTIRQLQGIDGFDQGLLRSLSGLSYQDEYRQSLDPLKNQPGKLRNNSELKQFVNQVKDYQNQVLQFDQEAVELGIARPEDQQSYDSRELFLPLFVGNILDRRNDNDRYQFGYLNDPLLEGISGNQHLGDLMREEQYLINAEGYLRQTGQGPSITQWVRNQQGDRVNRLMKRRPNLGEKLSQQMTNNQNWLKTVHQLRRPNKNEEANSVSQIPIKNSGVDLQARQRLLMNIDQQQMSDDEAENVVGQSRKIVHQVFQVLSDGLAL